MMALTAYPWAFPQQTRLVTGRSVSDPGFQEERRDFLKRFANVLRTGATACCVLLLLALLGCSRQPNNPGGSGKSGKPGAGAPVPVLVTQAVVKAMPVEVTGFGNVQAFSKVAVRSRISGELMKVHFQEGQDVKRGDLLFTIDPRPSQAALHQAEANLARDQAQADNARVEFDRNNKLFEAALISRDEYDKAESNLKALQAAVLADQAAVSNAALNLEFTSISSPIDARTGNLLVHPGNIVQAGGDVLVNLNQIRPIYVCFSVAEQHLGEITRRMAESKLSVEARVSRSEARLASGELSFIDNSVDATTGMIQLKATFPNQDNALWPGQFLQVVLNLKEQANSVVVPAQAVQTGQTNDFVFVVKADQTVEMRSVKPGFSRGGETVVERGLSPGETVITDGHLRLVPGVSKVSIRSGLMPASNPASVTAEKTASKGI
jgi:multidrug efflux system membrane fusion protein